jgi:hypothetical protein
VRRELQGKLRWNCRPKLCHPGYLSALIHARKLENDELIIYPCPVCHHLHIGHAMKQLTPQQKKKARLERRIAEVSQQLAQLRRNLHKLLAEETKPAATDGSNLSSNAIGKPSGWALADRLCLPISTGTSPTRG